MNRNVSDFVYGYNYTGNGSTSKTKDGLESETYLTRHESVIEIIKTTIHEDIHRVLWYDKFDMEKEHRAILIIMWAEEYF